jgi:16S rRNA processing protein RimM
MTSNKDKWIQLGRCLKPHGLKGNCFIQLDNSETQLEAGSVIYLKPEDADPMTIEKISLGPKPKIKLTGFDTIEDVQEILPFDVFQKRSDFQTLSEDEFYINDLMDFKVIDPQGNLLGKVTGFFDHGAGNILVFDHDGEETELPLIDEYFPQIDWDQQTILCHLPEYI